MTAPGISIDLSGRTALVTGGSRGIGRETVLLLARAGCRVAFFYRSDRPAASRTLSEAKMAGADALAVRADVASEQDVRRGVASIRRGLGAVDILINNAGIWPGGAIEKLTVKQWDNAFAVNVRGTFLPIKHTLAEMKRKGYGRIVNVSSTAAQRGEAFHSHYAATKGAIISLTKSLALELAGTGVTINAVAPGWVDTDMSATTVRNHLLRRRIEAVTPTGKISTAQEVAFAIVFLCADLSGQIQGEILNVNGGSVLAG